MNLEALKLKVVEAATKAFHEVLLPQVEIEVEKQIELRCEAIVGVVLAKFAEIIPGKFDDALIAQYSDKVKADIKALLLAEAEKISDKV